MEALVEKVPESVKRLLGLKTKPFLAYSHTRQLIRAIPQRERHVADAIWFNAVVITCIIIDSVIVGVEVDSNPGDDLEDRFVFWATDLIFAVVFTVEMVARVHQQHWEYFSDPWNIFDYICVSMGVTGLVQPAQTSSSQKDVVNLRVIRALKTLRILRLMRIVRHVGGLKIVEGLWLLISGLLASVRTLFWVGIFLLIMIYTFGVALMTIIGDHNKLLEEWKSADIYVGSVGSSMWTMLEVATFDAWSSEIFRPIVNVVPSAAIVLFGAILIITFGILNVMMGVMVEHMRTTMEKTKKQTALKLEDTEAMLIQTMGHDFRNADRDADGELKYKEFMALLKSETFAFRLRLVGVQFAEAEQLFHLMDTDDSGAVSPEEFVNGLNKLKGPAQGKELVEIINLAQKQCAVARKYVQQIERMSARATELQRRLDSMGHGMAAEVSFRQETKRHAKEVLDKARQRQKVMRKARHTEQVTYPSLTQ